MLIENNKFTVFNSIFFEEGSRQGITYATYVSDKYADYKAVKNIVERTDLYNATGLSSAGLMKWRERINSFNER